MSDAQHVDLKAVSFIVSLATVVKDDCAPMLLGQMIEHLSLNAEWTVTIGRPKERVRRGR